MDEKTVAELKDKHPGVKLHLLTTEDGDECVVRVPNKKDYQRWRSKQQDDSTKATALEDLLLRVIVHPTPVVFSSTLEERPGLAESFGGMLLKLAGGALTVEKKAL